MLYAVDESPVEAIEFIVKICKIPSDTVAETDSLNTTSPEVYSA